MDGDELLTYTLDQPNIQTIIIVTNLQLNEVHVLPYDETNAIPLSTYTR